MLHDDDERQRIIVVPDEPGEGSMGCLSGSQLRRTGLCADVQVRELPLSVHIHHIIAHHFRQSITSRTLQHPIHHLRLGLVAVAQGVFDTFHQIGPGRLTAARHSAHEAHILAGIDQIRILADAGPGNLAVHSAGQIKAAGREGHAVKFQRLRDSQFLRVLRQNLRSQIHRQLRKGHIAGDGQGTLQGNGTVDAVAVDGVPADLAGAAAVERPGFRIRQSFQGRSRCEHFEDGAGHIRGLEKTVQIHTVVGAGDIMFHIGHVVGIVARRSHGAENLPRFVVVHADGALSPRQSRLGNLLGRRRNGQYRLIGAFRQAVYAVHRRKAHQLVGVVIEYRRRDISKTVPQQMHGSLAQLGIVGIGSAVGGIQKQHAAPVCHRTRGQITAGIDMRRSGKHHPAAGVQKIIDQKHSRSQRQNGDQDDQEDHPA